MLVDCSYIGVDPDESTDLKFHSTALDKVLQKRYVGAHIYIVGLRHVWANCQFSVSDENTEREVNQEVHGGCRKIPLAASALPFSASVLSLCWSMLDPPPSLRIL